MAIYHLSIQTISRGQGKSCIASSAYRAGEKLKDEKQGLIHDYTKKQGVESEILAPSNSPSWVYDREKLWNEVDKSETRCNSRTAREINVALPIELSREQQKEVARAYVKENFVDKGMVADLCFHFNDSSNPHFHVMLTTRDIDDNGFTKKNRDWDKKENATIWREQWANHANKALEKLGFEERVDHRSYKNQGIDQSPTIHLGKTSSEMEKKGKSNIRAEINNQIKEMNQQKVIALQEYKELKSQLEKEKVQENQRYNNLTDDEKSNLKKTESFIGTILTFENANEYTKQLKSLRDSEFGKSVDIKSKIRSTKDKINRMKYSSCRVQDLEKRLSELPKGIFGNYKDKYTADMFKSEIEQNKASLEHDGYISGETIKFDESKIDELEKNFDGLNRRVDSIDENINILNNGVKALQNKERREFAYKYKIEFPPVVKLSSYDIRAIKYIQKNFNIEGIKPIITSYDGKIERLNTINNKLNGIEENEERLISAKAALETIDKTKGIVEKYDKVFFNRAKYQSEHYLDKINYDNAVSKLKSIDVKDKYDLSKQISVHKEGSKDKESLIKERSTVRQELGEYERAIGAINTAKRTVEFEKHKELQKTRTHKQAKGIDFER